MDIANQIKIMINEEVHKWRLSQKELSSELNKEIKRLEDICKNNGLAYKKCAKKRFSKNSN